MHRLETQLANVCSHIKNGATIKQTSDPDGIPVTRIQTISNGEIDVSKMGYAGIHDDEYERWYLESGDILFSHINSEKHIGKVALYEGAPSPLIHGMNLLALRPKGDLVVPRYLLYLLRSSGFRHLLPPITKRAVNQASISTTNLKSLSITLPSLSEQRRIVEILDQADELRKKRAEADKIADRILPAIFYKMFGDPTTNPMGWEASPIGALADVSTGNTPPRKNLEYYGTYLEWVKSDNLNTPSHYITRAREYLSEQGARIGRPALEGSTLVTCIAGSPSAIGNAALADRSVAFNQQINAATPREGVDSHYLYGHFLVGKGLIQSASSGGMKGIVSKSRFSEIMFLKPPSELQVRFGRLCQRECERNENRLVLLDKLDELFRVLLHRAFSGELTAKWREAHMKELLQEMGIQAKALGLDVEKEIKKS